MRFTYKWCSRSLSQNYSRITKRSLSTQECTRKEIGVCLISKTEHPSIFPSFIRLLSYITSDLSTHSWNSGVWEVYCPGSSAARVDNYTGIWCRPCGKGDVDERLGPRQCSVSLNKQSWCSSLVLMSVNERLVSHRMLTAREF